MDGISTRLAIFSFDFSSHGTPTALPHANPRPSVFEGLPPEILSWILYWALFDNAIIRQYGPPWFSSYQNLASVCRTWRDAILGTPHLWTQVITTDKLKRRLTLSKSMPLDIDVSFPSFDGQDDKFTALVSERHRWKRLSVTAGVVVLNSFMFYLKKSPPILEYLKLKGPSSQAAVDFAFFRAPPLEGPGVSSNIEIDAPALANLRSQCLSHISNAATDIEALLRHCPDLESLQLHNLSCRDASNPEGVHTNLDIMLLKLESLEITESNRRIYIPIVESIEAPLLRSFHFVDKASIYASLPFPHEILNDNKAVHALISRVLDNGPLVLVKISAKHNLLQITVSDSLMFAVRYPCEDTGLVLKNVATILQLDRRPVLLEVVWSNARLTTWRIILDAIQLVSLHVAISHLHELQAVCNFLAHWSSGCSHLKSFRITENKSESGEVIPKWDMEPVVQGMLQRARQRIVVELGEDEVFNPSTGKFRWRPREWSTEAGVMDKDKWSFAF